jgi:predicted DNA-binding transcriptional regulator YafY
MYMDKKRAKEARILDIYSRLMQGKTINKREEAERYHVDERSIQRDIDDIRAFLEEQSSEGNAARRSIAYNRLSKAFYLVEEETSFLTNSEILAISKILLESRAFRKDEMNWMLRKLISGCVPKSSQKMVNDLISNEAFHYVEPHHRKSFLDNMWEIGQAIRECHYLEIEYERMKSPTTVYRRLKPAAIMFSEYYFYLAAFIDDETVKKDFSVTDDIYPTIYRIDRIRSMEVLKERFRIPYKDRFEEGEFRKRIQFMYGGKLQRVKFRYSGANIEAVLDRLPTAKVLSEEDGVYTVTAEAFGTGIDMWLRSQGTAVELLQSM